MLNIFYSRYPPFLSHLITSYHLWVRQIADWQKPAQSRFVGPRCHFSLTYLQQYPGRSHCKRWQWCIGIWRTCLKNCGELMQVVGCCRDCTSQLTVERCWRSWQKPRFNRCWLLNMCWTWFNICGTARPLLEKVAIHVSSGFRLNQFTSWMTPITSRMPRIRIWPLQNNAKQN